MVSLTCVESGGLPAGDPLPLDIATESGGIDPDQVSALDLIRIKAIGLRGRQHARHRILLKVPANAS